MTDRADHVAFRNLCQDLVPRAEHGLAACQPERLALRISMIEVHLVRLEELSAVCARLLAQIPKEGDPCRLASLYSRNLAIAVATVIRYVGRMLARACPHGSV
jgi:hypothetical protein